MVSMDLSMSSADAVEFVIENFEGIEFVNHPDDRGGPTKYGITKKTLSRARGKAVRTDDIHTLELDEALKIYRQNYVLPVRGDEISYGPLRLAMIDYAIHSGPRAAVKALQEIVDVTQDGAMGPVTLGALRRSDQRGVFVELMAQRLTFLTRLVSRDTSQASFVYGWGKRLAKILRMAV